MPGVQPGDPVITNGNPTSSISWGTTTGPQSGYDFITAQPLPPPFDLPGPIPYFSLGTFQHRNFTVSEPWLVSAELDVELIIAVDGVQIAPLTFTFTINHDETPNNQNPCPYPTPPGEGCTDRVQIVASPAPTTFNVDGVDYTLEMSFLDNGSPVDEFITREGNTVNSTGLVGEFTLPPGLTATKTGPAMMHIGEWGTFTISIQNASEADAHNSTILDVLPDIAAGGMCDTTPEILSARVFEPDGVTPVPGKGPLAQGVDYSFLWDSVACEMSFTTLSAASVIGVDERLIIDYRTQLDTDTQDGAALTNVAGAIAWETEDGSTQYRRTLTDGTLGTGDHEDAHTVAVDLPVLRFEKTVMNVTTGDDPATTAAQLDTLRYRLYVENLSDVSVDDFSIVDELDALNADPSFVPGTLNVVSLPAGAVDNSNLNGGAAGTGLLDIDNLSIGGLGDTVVVEFEVQLALTIPSGTYVYNQSDLMFGDYTAALSDDPSLPGDEDPTRILVESGPPAALAKANSRDTATILRSFDYVITVPSVPHTEPLYDVRVLDDLSVSAADLLYLSIANISRTVSGTAENTGDIKSLVLEDLNNGFDIPAGEQLVLRLYVHLADTPTNVAGLTFTNTAYYTYNEIDGDPATQQIGDPGTTPPMTIVEPDLVMTKTGPSSVNIGVPETFTLDVHNTGGSPAYYVTLTDLLPNDADGGMCDAVPQNIAAQVFEADGTTPVSPVLAEGTDFTATFVGDPTCSLTLSMQSSGTTIGADQRLIVTFEAQVDVGTVDNAVLTNLAGATEWFSRGPAGPSGRTYTRNVTDGTVGTLDHEDAHTTTVFAPAFVFEKYAVNMTTGEDPATTATPGDVIRYTLNVEHVNDVPVDDFSIVDELDRLNATPVFVPGSLNVISIPAGADGSNTDATGGAAGTGLLDVRGLSLNGSGESFQIVFEVQLAGAIANNTTVLNQSEAIYAGNTVAVSDDPNVNGPADPFVGGDEDPTEILIQSAPYLDIDKISTYLEGDPNVLLAGETLRYTITVQNTGTENVTNVSMTDMVPANTTYIDGSTTLNGSTVADGPNGSPLLGGLLLGDMPNDGTIATVTFDVAVYPDVPDGTIISNQAFVTAADQGLADLPSDDPRTELVDDPTRDVVGNYPLLYATKTAALETDNGSPNIVDPGDTLRYTITVYNNGNVPATVVELFDNVPVNSTYVADTTTLDGAPVGQPDGGVFPLEGRIQIGNNGVLDPGASTTVEFVVLVDNVPRGTLITNQATVYSTEVANTLTDADSDPSNGAQPTVVVVGDAQVLSIVKDVAVVGGGAAIPGATLEYKVTVQNVSNVPALYVLLRDDLDEVNPGYLTYVDQSATLNGLPAGVSVAGQVITADYFAEYGALDPGQVVVLRFEAMIDPNLVEGTTIANTARVYWDDPQQTAEATVYIDVGAMPNAGMLSGYVWHDADHDNTLDGFEHTLGLWTVDLILNGQVVRSMQTDVGGYYLFSNVAPNYIPGETYALRFSASGATAITALLGQTDSDFTDGQQRIDEIDVQEGSNLLDLNMPVDPNGVIYDSITRNPVPGAVVRLLDARNSVALPNACFDDQNQQGQVTIGNGYYKFDINFSDPACPGPGNYLVEVVAPSTAYSAGVSEMIPPTSDLSTPPFAVPSCAGGVDDAVIATAQHCEAQVSEFAPAVNVPARSAETNYHLFLALDDTSIPGTSQLFNNHVPLDPRLDGAVAVTKTTPMLHVTRGQLVPYVITVSNSFGADLRDVNIVDQFPAGFKYVEGSARFDDAPTEPAITGRQLTWSNLLLQTDGRHEIKLLLAVGAGVTEGEFVNRAFAMNGLTGSVMSAEAAAKVRIIPDPTFDCTDVTGKVFNDQNRNGYQDGDEGGLPGVRVVTARGLAATTDAHGRYHITCAIVPNESRGSNFVLKLDDRTLPSGFRAATRPVQVQRATRGKSLKINFGASIHRVVGLDIADAVFEADTTVMREQWIPRLDLLLDELKKAPAVLRLSYVADLEAESLVNQRLDELKQRIMDSWQESGSGYELIVEPEIHWRLGGPVKQPQGGER